MIKSKKAIAINELAGILIALALLILIILIFFVLKGNLSGLGKYIADILRFGGR
jgi:uncharacterized protein YoxC